MGLGVTLSLGQPRKVALSVSNPPPVSLQIGHRPVSLQMNRSGPPPVLGKPIQPLHPIDRWDGPPMWK
jgi:hypothetical protein